MPSPDHPRPFDLTGADLYRLSCQSCHGPAGKGAPPAVASLLGPVQGTSAAAIQKRMAAAGREVSPALAEQLAADAHKSIVERLREGGEKMPPFDYLTEKERAALFAYLQRLAGVRDAPDPIHVAAPAGRVGELLARSTCQICHDATGPGNHHRTMMAGEIPSLVSLPANLPLSLVSHKVQTGQAGGMMMGRRRTNMPAFPYLTPQEIAATYLFLSGSLKSEPPGN